MPSRVPPVQARALPPFALSLVLSLSSVAFAASNLSQFPKKAPGPITSSAVVVDVAGETAVVFVAGNTLQAYALTGAPIKGFPLALGADEVAVGEVAAADMDGDGRAEIAFAVSSGKLYLVTKGAVAPGFPLSVSAGFSAGPSFADLDGDGRPELLQGDNAGALHVYKPTGKALSPFPLKLGPNALTSSPSVGKLGGSLAVAVGSQKGAVYVVDAKGALLPGFPLQTHFTVSGAPAFGDVDDDGQVDLVVTSADFNLYAVDKDGQKLPGFPFVTELALSGAPALADMDGDDVLDIAFTSTDGRLYVVNGKGKPLPGFPVKLDSALSGGVAVGDLDRDGKPDLVVASREGKVHVINANGKPVPGSPQKVGLNPVTPYLARLKDGPLVTLVGGADGRLAAFRFDLKAQGAPAALLWAGGGHDAARSGRFFPNPLRYKELAVVPNPAKVEDTLVAKWTYFSIDGTAEPAPPIVWMRNGQRMKELDGKREVPPRTQKKGERWRFELTVGPRLVKSPEWLIQDTPPLAPKVRINPGELSVKGSAKAEVVAPSVDADGDKVTYRFSWLLDGQTTDLTGDVLPASRLKKGQRWTAVVVPFDGQIEGAVATAEAKVANAPPGAPRVVLEPTSPRKGQVLAPILQAPGLDPDGDPVQHRYRWRVNGVALNAPLTQATLPLDVAKKGDTVALEVTAYDGKAEGEAWKGEVKLANTPPSAPKVALEPAEPRAGQALRAWVQGPSQDADLDPVTYRTAWTRNGKPYTPPQSPFEVAGADVKKGEVWAVTVTPSDGEMDGAPGTATATVRNTPPAPPTVRLKPEHPTTGGGLELVIVEPSRDVDGDAVKTSIVWTRNGKATGGNKAQAALTAQEFKKHEKVRVTVTPSDDTQEGEPGAFEVEVENAVPGAPGVALTPTAPTNQAPLKAVITTPAVDTDADPLQYRYTWLKNGAPQPFPESQAEVPARELKKGDVWTVQVRAHDGEVLGPPAKAQVRIGNAAPPAPKVALAPETPRRGQALRALLTDAVDPDGDVLSYRFVWKKGGVPVALAPQTPRVPAEQPRKGEVWSLEVTANDGQADSPVAKAEIKIANTPPSAPKLALEPEHPTTGGGLSLKVTRPSEDADGDTVRYVFTWTRNGVPVGGPEGKGRQALGAKEFKKHEKVRVVATPNDGTEDGPSAAVEVEVDNALPTAPQVELSPALPNNQGPLRAVLRGQASDSDGDALAYRYAWFRNGLRQAYPETQAEVPATDLKKGEGWRVVVRAFDGEALGPEASAQVEVGNAPPPAPTVVLVPERPRRNDEVRAVLTEAADPDGEPLTFRHVWKRNGQPVALEPTVAAVPREQPRKGETWSVDVIANDGQADSKAAHAEVKVANTPPGMPGLSLCDGPVPAGAPLEVKVAAASVDADGDPVTYRYEWTVNGQPRPKWTGRTTLGAGDTKKHDALQVTVTPGDGTEDGPPAIATCDVEDTPPLSPVAALEPLEPSAETGLKVTVAKAPEDRDGDAVTYRYAWLKNGLPFDTGGEGRVKPLSLRRGDALAVTVTSYDGERLGGQMQLATRVRNTPPPPPQVSLSPTQPVTGEALACTAKAPEKDVDGEGVKVRYRWLRNGQATPLAEDSPALPSGTVKKGEAWRCEAWTEDGYAASARTGADAQVKNSPPGAPKVLMEPESPVTGSELVCRVAAEAVDPDGDKVTYRYSWQRNGQPEAVDGPVVASEKTRKGETWKCSVTPTDGEAVGTTVSASKEIRNSPPGLARVALGPRDAKPGQGLRCELLEPAVDPDGDKVTYRFYWFKDGVEQNFAATSLEVPGRLIKPHELWSCEVQATDGAEDGPRASGGAVAVQQP